MMLLEVKEVRFFLALSRGFGGLGVEYSMLGLFLLVKRLLVRKFSLHFNF